MFALETTCISTGPKVAAQCIDGNGAVRRDETRHTLGGSTDVQWEDGKIKDAQVVRYLNVTAAADRLGIKVGQLVADKFVASKLTATSPFINYGPPLAV